MTSTHGRMVNAWKVNGIYDGAIFIGYPIWWGEIPDIVYTFMEDHDFAGKTVMPTG